MVAKSLSLWFWMHELATRTARQCRMYHHAGPHSCTMSGREIGTRLKANQQVPRMPRRALMNGRGFDLFSCLGSEETSVFFSVAESIHDAPGVSCRMK